MVTVIRKTPSSITYEVQQGIEDKNLFSWQWSFLYRNQEGCIFAKLLCQFTVLNNSVLIYLYQIYVDIIATQGCCLFTFDWG